MDFLKLKVVEYGMAFVIAPLAVIVMQALKRYSVWVDTQKPWVKRAVVIVTVFAFTALGHWAGVDFGITGDDLGFLATIDQTAIETVLGAAVAFGIHAAKKAAKK
jgi:hypothetical protein